MALKPVQAEQHQAPSIPPTSPATSCSRQQVYSPAAYAAYYASQLGPSTSTATLGNAAVTTASETTTTKRKAHELPEDEATRRKRIAREEDALLMREAAHRVAQSILADQLIVTYPDYKTPFRDSADVVQRLLPYHIFQQPDDDLLPTRKRNKRGKEIEVTARKFPQQNIDNFKTLIGQLKRRRSLQQRFHSMRTKDAKRESHPEQLYQIQYLLAEDDRRYNALLNAEIRNTRDQLAQMEKDAREKEKEQAETRKAYQAYSAQISAQVSTSAQLPASNPPPNPYAAYTAAAGTTVTNSGNTQQLVHSADYRTAYMQYAQAWAAWAQAQAAQHRTGTTSTPHPAATPAYLYAAATPPPASSAPLATASVGSQSPPVTSMSGTPTAAKAVFSSVETIQPRPLLAAATTSAATPATFPASVTRSVPTHPIPLQIPLSVVPAFESLGIRLVPITETASMTDSPPAGILVGSRENDQLLDITINLSLLDPTQLSGLAAVLNLLKTSGVSLQATTTTTTTTMMPNAEPATADPVAAPANTTASRLPNSVSQNPLAGYYACYQYYQPTTPLGTSTIPPPATISQQPAVVISTIPSGSENISAVDPTANNNARDK
ncbi:hypothetical protein DACRYDRAFT_114784 [Dacryopinax primogenitus]|uniref:GLTSCR protein conserved domain-containing protein n=1 Tax=Dacryopinax primogenitus (strain DJM 731) TaxID=1858805 RepID=M5GFV2_DACPD|nr:uncharacterized protein DACRYDRAFT_114784 [Dacryopinax primogenitus]EJU04463.1 hypothetical protein DACRYDRAFT_114784 [Dacryopinax primogenitus]